MSSQAEPIYVSGSLQVTQEVRAVATYRDARWSHSANHATLRVSSESASNWVTFWNVDPGGRNLSLLASPKWVPVRTRIANPK